MKKLVFLMIIGIASFVWGSQEVTVQVISAVYEKSITHEFDAKLKKSGLEVHKKIENGRYVVTLGTYPNEKSAEHALKKARLIVAKDAFIRPVNRNHIEVAHTAVIQPAAHAETAEHKASVAVVESSKHETPIAPVVTQEVKQPVTATLFECDKKEMRKDAFAEAINYYKTSPYHRFEPVELRQ